MESPDYKIQLENYYGPLDLLLHLIREEELNIRDIPIARITEQYISYLELMKQLDINLAGEFLVMAATLMEIKSRTLIPRDEEEPEEADPRFELVRKLIEYKKYKDLSRNFIRLIDVQSQRYSRPYLEIEKPEAEKEVLVELDLWGLVRTFSQLSKETVLVVSTSILYDDVPLERFIERILERLKKARQILFSELVPDRKDRFNMLKNLLATLELARQKQIEVNQEKDFADIKLRILER